jgi:hypothetical protein
MDQERLGEARNADDEAVAADKEREQRLSDHFVLPDDELLELVNDPLAAVFHFVGKRDVVLLEIFFDASQGPSSKLKTRN